MSLPPALQTKLEQEATAVVAARHARQLPAIRLQGAMVIHDAVMFSFMFGYLPPSRVGSIIAIHPPDFKGKCTDRDCQDKDRCQGNKVYDGEDGVSLHLPHHKEEKAWGHKAPLPFLLPAAMLPLLQFYLQETRPFLLQQVGRAKLQQDQCLKIIVQDCVSWNGVFCAGV